VAYILHFSVPIGFPNQEGTLNSLSISSVILVFIIGSIGMGSSSSSSPIGSSNMSGFLPKGYSNSQSPKKREG